MTRFLKITEGEGKGTVFPLESSRMIVGRSKDADIRLKDDHVSGLHLEIKVEPKAVFIQNKSRHGSSYNGKPLTYEVSLNVEDVIEIGHTKLLYGETDEKAAPPPSVRLAEVAAVDPDATTPYVPPSTPPPAADATQVYSPDGTVVADERELGAWKPPKPARKEPTSNIGFWISVLLLVLLLAGGGFWYQRSQVPVDTGAKIQFSDSIYGYSFSYPLFWSKISDDTNGVSFGLGHEGDPDWARVHVFTDKNLEYQFTGLTDGFNHYVDGLKQRYQNFNLSGSKIMKVHDATVMFYAFSAAKVQGKGIYLLNADERIVIEGCSPDAVYPQYAGQFSALLQSFAFGNAQIQQFIEFPLPEDGQRHLALASPEELQRQVDEHVRAGQVMLAGKDLKLDSLFSAVREFRLAAQLTLAPPQRLPAYHDAAQGLMQATAALNQNLQQERFNINRALRDGDENQAFWEASRMMQMVPDKAEPAYQEAFKVYKSTEHSQK